MKSEVFVSVSCDPVEDKQDMIEYAKFLQGKADFLHCDIMDGVFVDKKTFDFNLVKKLNDNVLLPLDVHLMVDEPIKQIDDYIKAGANFLTLHYESFDNKNDLTKAIDMIKEKGLLAGVSLCPETDFNEIKPFCFNIDIVLVMSVQPGKSGQQFIVSTFEKIEEIIKFRNNNHLDFKVSVDGGVNGDNVGKLRELGVDIIVSGSLIFNAKNKQEQIDLLKNGG